MHFQQTIDLLLHTYSERIDYFVNSMYVSEQQLYQKVDCKNCVCPQKCAYVRASVDVCIYQ